MMKIEIPVKVSNDKLRDCAFDKEKKMGLAKKIANKSLRDIEFELYMAAIIGGKQE